MIPLGASQMELVAQVQRLEKLNAELLAVLVDISSNLAMSATMQRYAPGLWQNTQVVIAKAEKCNE